MQLWDIIDKKLIFNVFSRDCLINEYRNELRAVEYYRRHLLARAVAAWHLYVIMMQRERETEQARLATQSKMAAFLDAAASGRLWTDKTPSDETQVVHINDQVNADRQTAGGEQMVWYILLYI